MKTRSHYGERQSSATHEAPRDGAHQQLLDHENEETGHSRSIRAASSTRPSMVRQLALGSATVVALGVVSTYLLFSQRSAEATHSVSGVRVYAGSGGFAKRQRDIELSFRPYQQQRTADGALLVIGQVANVTTEDMRNPQVSLQLIDDLGRVVHEATVPTFKHHLEPGESTPVQLALFDVPQHQSVLFKAYGQPEGARSDEVALEVSLRSTADGSELTGQVRNPSEAVVTHAKLQVLALDGEGKLLGISALALKQPLVAGDQVDFSIPRPTATGDVAGYRGVAWATPN